MSQTREIRSYRRRTGHAEPDLPRERVSFAAHLSHHSDGKIGKATLTQKAQTLEVAGVVRRRADTHASNTVLVECIGKAHKLAAIHVEEIDLVFESDPQGENTSDGKPTRTTERLLLTRTSVQK